MSRRNVTLIIVCEDVQQGAFARRYLEKRGFEPKRIRVLQNPRGSGEQFVRRRLVQEIRTHRQRSSYGHGGLRLIALIDADTLSVEERFEQVQATLEQEGLAKIQEGERIAIFIPKRNIETWLRYADGESVDEDQDYPKLKHQRSCRQQVDNYVNIICRAGIPDNAPDSLKHACDQLAKIL